MPDVHEWLSGPTASSLGDASKASARERVLMDVTHYTYVLIDPRNNDVFYVGKGIGKRMHDHLEDSIKGIHYNPKLQNKILKILSLGMVPVSEKIFEHQDEWPALANEMFAIDFYGLKSLCNILRGGDGGWWGLRHSEETKAKMSSGNWLGKHLSEETKAKISASRTGEKNHFFGKELSEEHKAKISVSNKGVKRGSPSEETKAKMSISHAGEKNYWFGKTGDLHPSFGSKRPHSEKTRQKISAAMMGGLRDFSEEHKANLSRANKGKRHSEESKAKMSAAKKGKELSEEHKDNIAASLSGEKNPFFGKTHSPESRARMALAANERWELERSKREAANEPLTRA